MLHDIWDLQPRPTWQSDSLRSGRRGFDPYQRQTRYITWCAAGRDQTPVSQDGGCRSAMSARTADPIYPAAQDIIPESDCEFCGLSHLLASLLDPSLSQGQIEAVPVTVARERGVIPEASSSQSS